VKFTDRQRDEAVAFYFPNGSPPLFTLRKTGPKKIAKECNRALHHLNALADTVWDSPKLNFSQFANRLKISQDRLMQWWAAFYLGDYKGLESFIRRQIAAESWKEN
jgi:hypothetical protein